MTSSPDLGPLPPLPERDSWAAPWLVEPLPPPPLPRPTARQLAVHGTLFALTAASVWAIGGWRLVAGLLAILFAHEMGHYVACRLYRVDATLPFFVPSPWILWGGVWFPLSFVGTFGAVIRIKQRIPHRKALFDIGLAGPLAGFVVLLPVLWLGMREATWVPLKSMGANGLELSEPLLFQWVAQWLRGPAPAGMTLALGPLGLAAWFGMFVTALNLIPVGQLDGGHVVHALMPRWAHLVSRLGLVACLGLLYFHPTWLLWTLLLLALGRRPHPPTRREDLPVDRARLLLGLVGLAVFALCFTPDPFLISWSDFLGGFGLTSR